MHKGLKWNRSRHDDALSRIGWDRLERLMADHYRGQGYDVEHVGTGRAGRTGSKFDGGIDLKLRRGGEYVLVQCKHWNACQVPHNDVHELLGIVINEDADRGIVITSGEFTAEALRAAGTHGRIELIDGHALRRMIGPLPEEPALPDATQAYSPSNARLHDVANAPERGTAAAEDHARQGPVRNTRGNAADAGRVGGLLKIVLLGAMILGGMYWINRVFENLGKGLVAGARQAAGQPGGQVQPVVSQPDASAPSTTQPMRDSATTTVGSTSVGPARTPAELRDWKRRQAESMKIIEASTPEMQRRPVPDADAGGG